MTGKKEGLKRLLATSMKRRDTGEHVGRYTWYRARRYGINIHKHVHWLHSFYTSLSTPLRLRERELVVSWKKARMAQHSNSELAYVTTDNVWDNGHDRNASESDEYPCIRSFSLYRKLRSLKPCPRNLGNYLSARDYFNVTFEQDFENDLIHICKEDIRSSVKATQTNMNG